MHNQDQEPVEATPAAPKNNLLIPVAIVIAGALVAGALFLTRTGGTASTAERPENPHLEKNLVAVSSADHIRGSADAPIIIVEHSDTDCPYCQLFHITLQKIVSDNPGKVAWVYRHFAFHEKAPKESEATECVASIGGNDKFWQYLDLIFSSKKFNVQPYTGIDPKNLPTLAQSIGVDKAKVAKCLEDGTFAQRVDDDYQNAQKIGVSGTPYSVIVSKAKASKELKEFIETTNKEYTSQSPNSPDIMTVSKDGKMIVVGGAMPADLMQKIIDLLIESNS